MSVRKHVLLTGASAGIGLEIARRITAEDFEVWGTSRDPRRLPDLPHFHPLRMDLSDPDSVREGVRLGFQQAGEFDVLINNAGNGCFAPLETIPSPLWRDQFETLVFGPMQLIQEAAPLMRKKGSGLILNFTSLAARFPIPFMGAYSSAKSALSSATECLRLELAGSGIQVVDVQCGDIDTPFHKAMKRPEGDARGDSPAMKSADETISRNMAAAPHPRIVAEAVLGLLRARQVPPIVTVGGFFQTKLAPALARFAPRSWVQRGIRVYYGMS